MKPPNLVFGGVRLNANVFGRTGLGPPLTSARAAIAVWGIGSVTRNGETLSGPCAYEVMALASGFHADDDTFTALRGRALATRSS